MDDKKYRQIEKEKIENKFLLRMGAGLGVGILALVGMAGYLSDRSEIRGAELRKTEIEKGCVFKEVDLNDNNIPEKFYEINGEKYFLEIDGKNLEAKLRGD